LVVLADIPIRQPPFTSDLNRKPEPRDQEPPALRGGAVANALPTSQSFG
jgi:hypothetical protein